MKKPFYHYDEENLDEIIEIVDELIDADPSIPGLWDELDSDLIGGVFDVDDPWGDDEA